MADSLYWVDASVYITAKQGPYRFKVWGIFWGFLSQQIESGKIRSPKIVYQEIVRNEESDDELSIWVKNRRSKGLCVSPNEAVQAALGTVADSVQNNPRYPQFQVAKFLSGADPWLVAHAMVTKGVVVTMETDLKAESKVIRIPDVCAKFNVRCINTSDMLEELGAEFNA